MTAPAPTTFAALRQNQGSLIRKPLAGILAVAEDTYDPPDPFFITVGTSELATLEDDWNQLGWISKSDGLTFSAETETSDVESWGALEPTRSDITKDVTSAQFTCQETNKKVLELYYNVDLSAVEGDSVTSEVAFNQSTEPATTYRRMIFLSKDGSGTREVYIAKVMPRTNVSAKADQTWNAEDALTYGMTITAKVDDDLGYAVRHHFAGPGWAAQLVKMGFTKATT